MTLQGRNALGWQLGFSCRGGFPDFGADHGLRDPRLVGESVGELIPRGGIRNARGHAKHLLQKVTAAVVAGQVVLGGGAVQQELEIWPRTLELGKERVAPLLLQERVGILTARQLNYVHVEAFAYEQLRAPLRRGLAGTVRVIAKDGLRGKAPQHLRLLRGERRAAGGYHREAAGLVDLGEVEIAFDDQCEVAFAEVALGEVQPVEGAALRVDRRLG